MHFKRLVTLLVMASVSSAAMAATNEFTGAAADWQADGNWSLGRVPTDADDVLIDGRSVTAAGAVSVRSLTVTGAAKVTFKVAGFDGASTEANLYVNATAVRVAEALVIDGTSVVTAENDPVTGAAVRFDCGSFRLGAKAKLTANEKGWFWYAGTDDPNRRFTQGTNWQTRAMGPGNSYTQGGGYGADGGSVSGGYCKAYGFAYAPFLPGSPNGLYEGKIDRGNRPGGTVWVKCGGLCELYGTVSADGNPSGRSIYGAASGGGVWIAAKGVKASGTTSVTAIGGYLSGSYGSYGAGGRISLALGCTDAQLDALARGETPEGLSFADGIDLFAASARGGEKGGVTPSYGKAGTVTTVTGPEAWTNVKIGGSPVSALGVEPTNGTEAYAPGSEQTFTAPEYGADPDNAQVRYPCTGYAVTDASGAVVKSGSGRTVEIEMANGPLTLTWQWGAAQYLARVRKPEHGVVLLDGVQQDGDAVQWTAGAMRPVTVVPDEGYEFVCWEGSMPLDQATSNPIACAAPGPVDLTPVLRRAEAPTTRTWNGTGRWTDATQWSPQGNIPGPEDDVVITGGTCAVPGCFAAKSVTVTGGGLKVGSKGGAPAKLAVTGDLRLEGAATLTVFGGPIEGGYTFATGTSFVSVGGALTLDGTSVLSLSSDALTGGSVKIDAQTVSVGASAKIDARGKGYAWLDSSTPPDAPGLGYSYSIGGSHGGKGGSNTGDSVYDSLLAPIMPGSPNGSYSNGQKPGGGVIRIHARTISIDGTLDADAVSPSTFGGSAGGSIWLTADTFAFGPQAKLTAEGGPSNYSYSMGGGGRIALAEGCSAEELACLAAGELPQGAVLYDRIDGVAASVLGGKYNNGSARAASGTVAFVRSRSLQTYVNVRTAVEGLVTEGDVCGAKVVDVGESTTFAAPAYGYDPAHVGEVRWPIVGYVVSNCTAEVARGDGRSYELTARPDGGPYTFTWLLGEKQNSCAVKFVGDGAGTVSDGETTASSDFLAWGAVGASITLTATAAKGSVFAEYRSSLLPDGYSPSSTLTVPVTYLGSVRVDFESGCLKRVYVGDATSDLADPLSWLPRGVPTADEAVIFSNAVRAITTPLKVAQLTVSGGAITFGSKTDRKGFSLEVADALTVTDGAKVTFYARELDDLSVFADETAAFAAIRAAASVVTVGGDFVVRGGATVCPDAAPISGVPVMFRVGGDVRLEADGTVDASSRGWGWATDAWADCPYASFAKPRRKEGLLLVEPGWTLAPGAGLSYGTGGNYGGTRTSTSWQNREYARAYGSAAAPFLPGSPSGNYKPDCFGLDKGRGGGAIDIVCAGRIRLDGRLVADGNGNDNSGSSGGGIWLAASGFDIGPGASASARGGDSGNHGAYGPACGGRIAFNVGLSAAQVDALCAGGASEGVEVLAGLPDGVTASVTGGRNPSSGSFAASGTLRTAVATNSTFFTVTGSPVATDGIEPAVGTHTATNGAVVRFAADEYGVALDGSGVRYACCGYALSNACGTAVSGTGRTVDVAVTNGPFAVTWLWGEPTWGIRVHKPGHGTLTQDGVSVAGDLEVWTNGVTPAFGVVPDEGWLFAGWEGNLPPELALENPFSLVLTNGVEVTPKVVRGASPSDASIIALLSGRGKTFATAIDVSPTPEAFGVELAKAADGAVVTVEFIDAKKNAFAVSVPVTGAYALFPPDAAWALPVKVAAVRVTAGDAELKSLRGVFAQRLPHAEPYFAALESLEQPLVGGTLVTADRTRVDIPEAGVRLVLHKTNYNTLNFVWDDGTTLSRNSSWSSFSFKWGNEGKLGLTNGTSFTVSDAAVGFTLVGTQYVRPNIGHYYESNPALTAIGLAYAADCEQLPKASEHVLDLRVEPNEGGGAKVFMDGSYISLVRSDSRKDARLVSAHLSLNTGVEYALNAPPPAYDGDRWTVLDLSANPRAKAFKDATLCAPLEEGWILRGECPVRLSEPLDSADVAICHYAHKSGGYSDIYVSREPSHGFGGAVHYRVPARDYVRAHLVVALDTDAAKDRVLTLRVFSHSGDTGESGDCGANLVVDTTLDWTDGIGAGAERIGLVQRGEELIPLYAVTVPLDLSKLVPEAARNRTLDVEFMGPKTSSSSLFPDPARTSAFNLFGVTLESAPVTLDIVQDGCTGNVFTQDEAGRHQTLRMKAIRDTSGATVSWTARTREGRQLFAGSGDTGALAKGGTKDIAIDLSGVTDPDLYLLDLAVSCEDGAFAYTYPTRFAIVPPSGRAVAPEDSPFATWWNCGSHGTTKDWAVMGPFLQKAGIRKVNNAPSWDRETLDRYNVTFTGQCAAPAMSNFNITNGQFFARDGLSGEEWFVKNIRDQIAAKPRVDHIMIWHESAPSGDIPEEILGLPVPEATESDRKAGAYVNEIGRLVRQYFPNLRLQIGNSTASLGAASKPLRGGADPQYYDSVGIEIPSQTMMPERLLVQSIQGMMMTKESASYYAKRPVRACGCFEYTYRTTAIGEELQAAYYMRDTLISLANEMPMISPGIIVDAKDYYYQNLYGCCGMAYRTPWCEPKLAYVAYAALTKALDGVTLLEELPTGSTTVYALSFRRCDGKYAVAIWTARGEATLQFTGAASGERMGFLGKVTPFDGTAVASEHPSYVITDTRLTAAEIVKRGFRQAETAASRSVSVCRLADDAALTVAPDARIKSKTHKCLPMMTPSEHFSARTVLDREKGRCVEVALDTSAEQVNRYYTEYSTLRFAEPAEVPAGATAIGVWTKGNSSWGQVRFEITDADGDVYVTYDHPGSNYDPCDWQGTLCVNFDDWAYVSCKLPNNGGLAYSAETGLRTSPWYCEVRKGNGTYDGPGRLTAITVGINREKLDLTDFKPTDTRVRLADVRVEGAGLPGPEPEVSINVWEGGATGDWSDPAGWSLGRVPTIADDVLVENATLTATNAIAARMLVLENTKLTVKAPELTDYSVFETLDKTIDALRENALVVRIADDFIVNGTSVVCPEAAQLTGVPVIFRVGGAFTLEAKAKFDVRNRGWGWSAGLWAERPSEYCKPRKTEGNDIQKDGWTLAPGSGLSYGTGGTYGGQRTPASWQGKTYAQPYGTAFAPWLPGSPSGNYTGVLGKDTGRGPGSIVVLAEGAARVDGQMLADGNGNDHSGTSGGGIWLAASKFAFGDGAALSAIGGNSGNHGVYGTGYGGRIALAEGCTAADIDAMLAGTLSDELLIGPDISLVATNVRGGQNPSSKAYGASGTVAMVRPK